MKFEAKLNFKFYIATFLLLGIVVLGWYSVFFLNSNEILMEDNMPMDNQTKMLFGTMISIVLLSWSFSFLTMLRQILIGHAFSMDAEGIHLTATAINVLAFIFIVPIRKIPYSAIEKVSQENRSLCLHIDKSEIDIIPIFRVFARKKYYLFSGFTVAKQGEIENQLKKYGVNIM